MASINRLSDIPWKLKYSPEDGSLLRTFYHPAFTEEVNEPEQLKLWKEEKMG